MTWPKKKCISLSNSIHFFPLLCWTFHLDLADWNLPTTKQTPSLHLPLSLPLLPPLSVSSDFTGRISPSRTRGKPLKSLTGITFFLKGLSSCTFSITSYFPSFVSPLFFPGFHGVHELLWTAVALCVREKSCHIKAVRHLLFAPEFSLKPVLLMWIYRHRCLGQCVCCHSAPPTSTWKQKQTPASVLHTLRRAASLSGTARGNSVRLRHKETL